MDPSKWLLDEDALCFNDRVARLEWLAKKSPIAEYWTFPGGLMAKSLFEEARYCFAYGQFLAANLLGLAYIELTLSALFYESGRNDLKRAGLAKLLKEAYAVHVINAAELEDLGRIRKKRNSYAHFRRPGDKEGIESRAVVEDDAPYRIIERDATDVIAAALRMVDKNAV